MEKKQQTLVACGDILIECECDEPTVSSMFDEVRDEIQGSMLLPLHAVQVQFQVCSR